MALVVFSILVPILCYILYPFSTNNSCDNYWSYLNIHFSNNCYHIPDLNNDVPEIIERHIGRSETHQVETEDGYILTIFRIPRENPKDVIYFHHPLGFDARFWVAQYKDSIAFKFWQRGYDVWLGNARGTFYSKKHKFLTPDDRQFWNHTVQEFGHFDNFAAVDYIKAATNRSKIIYLGMSAGGKAGLIYASTRATMAAKSLKIIVAIAPVIFTAHIKSLYKSIKPLMMLSKSWDEYMGAYSSTARHNSWYMNLYRLFHYYFPFKRYLSIMFNPFFGHIWNEFDPNYANLMVTQIGSEFSLKSIYHSHQLRNKFHWYDYGEETNFWVYGSTSPPLCPLDKIKVPVFMVNSLNDSLSNPDDVETLYSQLPDKVKRFGRLIVDGMNHNDFGFGKHRMEKVYNKIIKVLDGLQ